MKKLKVFIFVIAIALLTAMFAHAFAPTLTVIAQNVACYNEQGGAKRVAASGCEYEFLSGSTIDVQSGATETHANNPTFSGDPVFSGDPSFSGSPNISGDITANSLVVTTTSDLQGNVSDSGGVLTIADNAAVTGQADAIQLTVTGYTTQTSNVFVVENSGGTDLVTIDGSGDVAIPNTLNLKGDAFPLLTGADDTRWACGSSVITGTGMAATGLTTATYALATLVTDPGVGAGDPFLVTVDAPTTSSITINVWQDGGEAGTSGATVHWCALGDD